MRWCSNMPLIPVSLVDDDVVVGIITGFLLQLQNHQILVLLRVVGAGDGHGLGRGASELTRDVRHAVGGRGGLVLLEDCLQGLRLEGVDLVEVFLFEPETAVGLLDEAAVDGGRRRDRGGGARKLANLIHHLGFLDDGAVDGVVAQLATGVVAFLKVSAGDQDVLLGFSTGDDRVHIERGDVELLICPLDGGYLHAALDWLLLGGIGEGRGRDGTGFGEVVGIVRRQLQDSLAHLVHANDQLGRVFLDILIGDIDDLRELLELIDLLLQIGAHDAVSSDHVVNQRALEEVTDLGAGCLEQLWASDGRRHDLGGLALVSKARARVGSGVEGVFRHYCRGKNGYVVGKWENLLAW
ncbi:hypothetical protein PG993_012871 [Apiospora rasikravindrae]|uniref:Uncharacterized protein n=1 Tax=Apiospora rasikravindrae TaxID=990691 RepID=A0ABR1RW21_9PEZI